MTPSEVAFLALGLVLGLASGAALIEVFRARPPTSREIRVTVAPNAIHARMAATLADPTGLGGASAPARGGPGDRRWHDDEAHPNAPAPARRAADLSREPRSGAATAVGPAAPVPPRSRTLVPSSIATPGRRDSFRGVPTGGPRALVAVPMSREPDPLTAAIGSSAEPVRVTPRAPAGQAGGASPVVAVPGARVPGTALAASTAAIRASAPLQPQREDVPSATMATEPTGVRAEGGAEPGAERDPERGSERGETSAPAAPCAEERRIADERCAVASRAREGATAAADELRATQRAYDEHVQAAESSAAAADPRAVRSSKEAAQQRFREARQRAGTHEDIETAARSWLAEINQINQDTRDASSRAERSRAEAAGLSLTLERLAVAADAARISAERAEEACVAAREAVASCDEAQALEVAAASAGPGALDDRVAAAARGLSRPPTTTIEAEAERGESMASRAGADALILRILRGDREALQRAVALLDGDDADAGRRWQARLGGLADALIARAIEASALDFPTDHFFWGPFSQVQCRDIAAGLSSLGFRFDGFGGWVEEHVPSQRDLSLAVGYAGLDPMRIRHWPNEAEMRELFSGVRVAADEYVAEAAGSMTLGELVSLLGRRADGLTELWNDWGTVRPILLGAG